MEPIKLKNKPLHPFHRKWVTSFLKKFEPAIIAGTKTTTIRTHFRGSVGDVLRAYTGAYKKGERCWLADWRVKEVIPIWITPLFIAKTDDLTRFNAEEVALSDGFDSFIEMYAWFLKTYKKEIFEGVLIVGEPLFLLDK